MNERSPQPNRGQPGSGTSIWLLVALLVVPFLVLAALRSNSGAGPAAARTTYSQLIQTVERKPGSIREVVFEPASQAIAVTPRSGAAYTVNYPSGQSQASFQALLERKGVRFDSKGTGGGSSLWGSLLGWLLPFLLLGAFWVFLMRRAQGGAGAMGQASSMAKSRAKRIAAGVPRVRFDDVAGCEEAVEELGEVVEFLRSPRRFLALGARIPRGVLLYGPPGTGKTLLARAVAGEAGVPFFSCSGSEFVEMFVGVGASRVRDLFEQAKKDAPCIVFVDEIDALGRQRGAGLGGGHDEREQTLNQMLVEMDGFDAAAGVIVLAATNRPDILDPALLRPGRFDRQVAVDRPDRIGRRQILSVHASGKPVASDVDLDSLAAATAGFTGADLANLLNEAALLAARRHETSIGQPELEEGIMRVVAGPEKKTRVLSEQERTITAYHEMGHALVGHFLEHTDPVHKITIVARGQALGLTVSLPTEDRYLTTKSALLEQMAMTLGGRAAEEIVFGEITSGAANDLEKVTETARQMIMRFGMSDKFSLRVFGHNPGQPFLGRDYGAEPDYSEEKAREIDDEIGRLINQAHELALSVLRDHEDELHRLAHLLLERETIERDEFQRLLAGEPAPIPAEKPAPDEPRRQRQPERPRARRPQPLTQPAHVFAQPPNPDGTPR